MSPADVPLNLDRILSTAEDVIRRFGPAKATVVDVARALGVSHAAVYRHVATKAELRDMVVGRWIEATMAPLRAIAAQPGPAPARLRRLFDTMIAVKRRRAADDPELFAAYRTLAADARSVVAALVDELVGLAAMVIRSGVEEGTFRAVEPAAAGRALLFATSRFHHPAHAAEWVDPAIDATFDELWRLLMNGLCIEQGLVRAGRRSPRGAARSAGEEQDRGREPERASGPGNRTGLPPPSSGEMRLPVRGRSP
jgi:AcrR family transcriptional regulator